jgi:hypothetical protein
MYPVYGILFIYIIMNKFLDSTVHLYRTVYGVHIEHVSSYIIPCGLYTQVPCTTLSVHTQIFNMRTSCTHLLQESLFRDRTVCTMKTNCNLYKCPLLQPCHLQQCRGRAQTHAGKHRGKSRNATQHPHRFIRLPNNCLTTPPLPNRTVVPARHKEPRVTAAGLMVYIAENARQFSRGKSEASAAFHATA